VDVRTGDTLEIDGHVIDLVRFRASLLAWGRENFRAFPWRETTDPYRILMAEVMLHRTQAVQVAPVYERFVERYPDVAAASAASLQDLHDVLYSLGLRWRIDLIHEMVRRVVAVHGGEIPESKQELLDLPGVSDYVASAVRCFASNLPEALVDTNTVRVAGRLFGLEIKDSSRRNRRFRDIIERLVDPDEPRAYNYALLDLADRICTKKRPPASAICPVLEWCRHGLSTVGAGDQVP